MVKKHHDFLKQDEREAAIVILIEKLKHLINIVSLENDKNILYVSLACNSWNLQKYLIKILVYQIRE